MASGGLQQLDELVRLITAKVQEVKVEYAKVGQPLPTLDDAVNYPLDTQHTSQQLFNSIRAIQGACAQLSALVAPPQRTVISYAMNHTVASSLSVAVRVEIADHLKDHPDGLSVSQLAALTKINENKLSRILRVLATKHCFKEVSPNVFANNRLSMVLTSDNNLPALAALMYDDFTVSDEGLKAGAQLYEALSDPAMGSSDANNQTAFNLAFNHSGTLWEYFAKVDPARGRRFERAMTGLGEFIKFDAILHDFPWDQLPAGTSICDVGGGVGHVVMHLALTFKQLNVVLQDQPHTIEQAKRIWAEKAADVLKAGRARLEPIDFTQDVPVRDCDFYFIKHVIHNWSDEASKKILTNVRKAMKPSSRLLIRIEECIMPYASREGQDTDNISQAPSPLLPNYGEGGFVPYAMDILMMNVINSRERTLDEYNALGKYAGFDLVKVWHCEETDILEYKLASA
ncbi:S-adenosyl-L-methionine-dependent methyltransferase [Panus rudis PR-1116 ss-1]|nr:S-adenosyl-L-methionine-dependent methyltransferase [Panus rudis PR-1116 ss-1]